MDNLDFTSKEVVTIATVVVLTTVIVSIVAGICVHKGIEKVIDIASDFKLTEWKNKRRMEAE